MIPVGREMKSGTSARRGGEAELVDALEEDVGIEDAEDRLLAERGRHRAHPELHLAAALVALDAAVLGPALLGEVGSERSLMRETTARRRSSG